MPLAFMHKRPLSPMKAKAALAQAWFFSLAMLLFPAAAYASDTTLGDVICNAKINLGAYPYILNVVAYIVGSFLAVRSFLLFKRHAENPAQPQAVAGMAHLLAAAALLALPAFVSALQSTFFGAADTGGNFSCGAAAAASASSGSVGLDVMMQNFVKNIYGPIFMLVALVSISVGLTYIVGALLRAAKTGTNPQAADPKSIFAHLIFGSILVSVGTILPDVLQSIFGASDISKMTSVNLISWSNIVGSEASTDAADKTIRAVLAFIQIVGCISFVRGWMIMKKAVEGGGQATIQQGLTHVIGGAMAVNIDVMLKVFDTTFGTGIIN